MQDLGNLRCDDLFDLAEQYREQMKVREAISVYDAAELAGYDADLCGAARWTCRMLMGDWESAWLESDKIAQRGGPDPHRYWDGTDWKGKDVLIRCLHGLGDTLQFVRYASLLRASANSVTIESQPKLKTLLESSGLADSVITWGEPEPRWQVQMEVNELPRIFRTRLETVPNRVPYLKTGRSACPPRGDGRLKVGLVWAASNFDQSRNVPLALLEPLFDLPEVTFVSLQAGEGWSDAVPTGLTPLSARNTSIEVIAAAMEELDLILTVDTMNAHLAGGLGLPTWTMLPFYCDWRWTGARADTPWYPTMRLFRQPSAGDWEPVIEQVRTELSIASRRMREGSGRT